MMVGDESVNEFKLVNGLDPADVVLAHREALRVLRPVIEAAHLDAYGDDAFPPHGSALL